nr:hypothetical protein [Tanacetum cinerariifolium]
MNDKMNDPECVTRKVKIAPHDYSKDNLLATFTPQKQLTPEQIFWSNDLMKIKSEALKERTKVSRPIKAFMVYPPNTPAALVPKVLPTKSQVKILIFTLIQLFSEFDQTCRKRITPSAITDGERGFEQTKACYLQEVIPFFKTLKDNFKGIQKALTKEVKEMKDVFEELEAEATQYAVDRKHNAIKLKNLLIANDNLIAECLSQEVFCVATNSDLNVARFIDMHVANTTAETRCLALEAELANLYKNTPDFDSVFVIGKMQASLQGKDNVIRQLKKELSQLQVTCRDTDHALRVQTTESQISKLTDQVTHLQAQNDLFRAENDKIKQYYKELYNSIKITRAKHIEQMTKVTTENMNLKTDYYKELYNSIKITRAKHIEQMTKVTTENMNLKTDVSKATVNPLVSARDKHTIDVKPIVPRLRNNWNAYLDYLRHLKESVETIRDIVEEAKVVKPLDRSIVSACRYTKHSQELLEYAIGTCPHGSQPRVDCCPIASGSQPMSHVKPNRISPAKGDTKLPIDEQPRKNKSHLRTSTRIDSSSSIKRTVVNSNSDSVCHTCAKCLTLFNHDLCVATCLQSAMATPSIHYNRSVERKVVQIVLCYVDSGCSEHMKGNYWFFNKMADVNIPSDQTPTMAPPVRADDQILPHLRWIPIGKSNCYLDLEKSQSNPIYKIAVDLLKNTNFFRAFTASSNLPSIYIQQFWDTILYDKKAGCYKCQLHEQWFDLTKETLREALQI